MNSKKLTRTELIKVASIGGASVVLLGVLALTGTGAKTAGTYKGYTPGTYTYTAKGISSDVSVTMTFSDSQITAVDVDSSGETPEIGGAAESSLEEQLLSTQSADIDGVAGASLTSGAAKTAAEYCISKALDPDFEPPVEEVVEATPAPVETETIDASEGGLTDGTYTASAQGISSQVGVTITVSGGVITDVQVDGSGETPAIGGAAASTLAEQLLAAQSSDIDGVAGASLTTAAAKEAFNAAVSQAMGSDAESGDAADAVTYSASAQGISSQVTVTITVSGGVITDVQVDGSGETPALGGAAAPKLAEQLLAAQSSDIDGVAGATVTSTAAKQAFDACVAQMNSGSAETETAEETTASEEAETAEPSTESAGLADGTYTASAQGISSQVGVTVTVSGGMITDVQVDSSGETPAIGGAAGTKLADQLLTAQSSDIDGVAGATYTTNAAKTAFDEALEQAAAAAPAEQAAENTESAGLTDGTYMASAQGISSQVGVTITVSGGMITDVQVDSSGETPAIGGAAGTKLADQLLTAQSSDIDGVAGATYTTNAAKQAFDEALEQAAAAEESGLTDGTYMASAQGISSQVGVTITVAGGMITDVQVDSSGETPAIGGAAGTKLAAQLLEAQTSDIDGVAGATYTTKAAKEAFDAALEQASAKSESALMDGTYTASAQGISSQVAVTITVSGGVITDVQVDGSGETPAIGGTAAPKLAAQLLEAQSSEIDGVAGASYTSKAAKEAFDAALAMAMGN